MAAPTAYVVLGSQPDAARWAFPEHVHAALREAAAGFRADPSATLLVTSGDRSLDVVRRRLPQPFRECDALADELLREGVPADAIAREGRSRDVVSNLYYVKTDVLLPRGITRVVLPLAHWRVPRIAMVADTLLGPEYRLTYIGLPDRGPRDPEEDAKFRRQAEFLRPLRPGEHERLDGAFYADPFYAGAGERS